MVAFSMTAEFKVRYCESLSVVFPMVSFLLEAKCVRVDSNLNPQMSLTALQANRLIISLSVTRTQRVPGEHQGCSDHE